MFDEIFEDSGPGRDVPPEGSPSLPEQAARSGPGAINLHETARDRRLGELREVEEEVLRKSAEIVRSAARFAEVDPNDLESVPDEWVREYGSQAAAEEAFRVAKYALMSNKDAPVGLRMAQATFVGITKARATEKSGPKTLNVAYIAFNAPQPDFPEIEIDE